jgi:hypothetical protein
MNSFGASFESFFITSKRKTSSPADTAVSTAKSPTDPDAMTVLPRSSTIPSAGDSVDGMAPVGRSFWLVAGGRMDCR